MTAIVLAIVIRPVVRSVYVIETRERLRVFGPFSSPQQQRTYIIETGLTFRVESSSISLIIGRLERGISPIEFNTAITYKLKVGVINKRRRNEKSSRT